MCAAEKRQAWGWGHGSWACPSTNTFGCKCHCHILNSFCAAAAASCVDMHIIRASCGRDSTAALLLTSRTNVDQCQICLINRHCFGRSLSLSLPLQQCQLPAHEPHVELSLSILPLHSRFAHLFLP